MPRTKDVSQSALIAAVEQHAELWDLEHPQYADRVYKLRAWDEVYKALTSNWDRLSPQDKKLRGDEFRTRWKSLRDRLRRDITDEQLARNGVPARGPRRRPHPYATELAFLRRPMESRVTTSNLAEEEEEEEGEDSDEGPSHSATASEEMVARLSPLSMQGTAAEEETPVWQTRHARRQQATSSIDDHILQTLNDIRTRHQKVHSSEDAFLNHANRHVAFCRSILPMLEDLPFQRSMQATDDIYCYLAACRSAYRENLPAPRMTISTPATYTAGHSSTSMHPSPYCPPSDCYCTTSHTPSSQTSSTPVTYAQSPMNHSQV